MKDCEGPVFRVNDRDTTRGDAAQLSTSGGRDAGPSQRPETRFWSGLTLQDYSFRVAIAVVTPQATQVPITRRPCLGCLTY